MTLIDNVKSICDRLSLLGWRELLKAVTANSLDIRQVTSASLKQILTSKLPNIDRSIAGFEDFSMAGQQAITPGQPSLSLLYHALASPIVTRDQDGSLLRGFATPAELDALENLIFGLAPVNLPKFIADNGGINRVAVVVFSYEYRPAAHTVDGRNADLTFSRTGIARVGTAAPLYLPESRGFWPEDEDNPHNIRVLPAKFSAWLSVKSKGSSTRVSPILDNQDGQAADEPNRDFWVPVHKLFEGPECVLGLDLNPLFSSSLFNLKIQRVHRYLGTAPLPTKFPYVIRDAEIGDWSMNPDFGPGWLIPKVRPSLVEPAIIDGTPLTFKVSKKDVDVFASFEPKKGGAPAYVHARTRVSKGAFEDLNDQPDVVAAMTKGSYEALHYIDYTGDGWISLDLPEMTASKLKIVPAYSLVSAPDFFPSGGQFELSEWSRSKQVPLAFRDRLWSDGQAGGNADALRPTPLSEIRLPANLQLPGTPFVASDSTISALVGMGTPVGAPPIWPVQMDARRASSLPDDAAGVFSPGWDVSTDMLPKDKKVTHFAAYALGSPFPEDAKLCAALSTFWPAVAPDVFRTFVNPLGNTNGTIAPLTDEEIGQSGTLPWDGIAGPQVIMVNDQPFVEFASFLNADYVRQAVQNRFSLRLTSRVDGTEYEARMLASCRVYSALAGLGDIRLERNKWLMLSFRTAPSGDAALQSAQAEAGTILKGKIYAVRVCRIAPVVKPKINARTDRMPLIDSRDFFASSSDIMVLSKQANDSRFGASRSEP